MKFKVLIAATVAVLSGLLFVATAGQASAAIPNCGGQDALPQPVPYTCNLPGKDITSQGVTRHFSAQVKVDGTFINVTFLMTLNGVPKALPVDVDILIDHHIGKSGDGGPDATAKGVIPKGQTTATLTVKTPCFEGQLDVFAVDVVTKGDTYRVGGPWIQNGVCVVPTTTPTTTPGSTTPSTTAPQSSTVPTSVPNTSGGPGVSASARVEALPATGAENGDGLFYGLLILSVGIVLVGIGYHRKGLRH